MHYGVNRPCSNPKFNILNRVACYLFYSTGLGYRSHVCAPLFLSSSTTLVRPFSLTMKLRTMCMQRHCSGSLLMSFCRFVFRHGSPLVPDNLREVAAAKAGAIIVVSDSNRYASTCIAVEPSQHTQSLQTYLDPANVPKLCEDTETLQPCKDC